MCAKQFRRKDLKHDELITVTNTASRWLMQRRRRIGWVTLVIVLALSVVVSIRFAHQRQEQNAAALLAAAMEAYRAPVVPPAPAATAGQQPGPEAAAADPGSAEATSTGAGEGGENGTAATPPESVEPPPGAAAPGLQFATSEEKFRAARARFAPIVERYGSRPSGRLAAFYLGICEAELGDSDAAVEAFTVAADASEPLIADMALYRLAQFELAGGNAVAAVEHLDRLLAAGSGYFPREEALMAKARAQEGAGDPRAALATYQRVVEDFAGSYAAADARNHVEEISAQLGLDPNVEGD